MRMRTLGIAVALVALLVACKREERASKEAQALKERADRWRQGKNFRCPTFADLEADARPGEKIPQRDPWGTPYAITCDINFGALIRSAGPDKKLDTNDDITAGSVGVFFPH
jgi:hypothetical protein